MVDEDGEFIEPDPDPEDRLCDICRGHGTYTRIDRDGETVEEPCPDCADA